MCINEKNIISIELVADQNGQPMMKVTEKNGVSHELTLICSFVIHIANEFLRSLNLGIDITFESFKQYDGLIGECSEVIHIRNRVIQ